MVKDHTLDEAGIRRIVDECYDGVLAYCRRHTDSPQDAQDVTQETFLRLVRSRSRYADEGKPIAFLLTVARNLCADRARSGRFQPGELDGAIIEDGGAEGRFAAADVHLDVRTALGKLPEDLREAVELRYGQDLMVKDVARVLGISRFAARRRINAALAQLGEALGPGYGDDAAATVPTNEETMRT